MKKKERAHLKEDPFQVFIHHVLDIFQQYKKEIILGVTAVLALIIILVAVAWFRTGSVASENRIYSKAISIKNNDTLNVDQKIEELGKLEPKSGVSASVKLFLAALYFEKGDVQKAGETLESFSKSSSDLINSEKKLLEAEILNASKKTQEALNLLNTMLSDPKSQIAKDFILLRMAKIQAKAGQNDAAIDNLNKIIDEYAQSYYSYEARNLLTRLEKK
jgi:predicted negative regulator of RcsB-dependent stress response